MQSVPPHTSGTSPSSSLSSGANTHVALAASHISSRVHGSLSTHSEGDPQMLPTRQPRVGWHTPLSAQSDDVGVCRQLPDALQLSTVQATASSQSPTSSQATCSQTTPLPLKPPAHSHMNAATVSVQMAFGEQLSVPSVHSSTGPLDVHTRPSPT